MSTTRRGFLGTAALAGAAPFINRLTPFGDRLSAERSLDNMPTCSLYTLEFDIQNWGEISWGSGANAELIYPGSASYP